MHSQRIDQRLLAAQVAIDNALDDPETAARLLPFGYDEARLREGRALYEEAARLASRQRARYGKQYQATQDLTAARRRCRIAYGRTLRLARVAFRGDRDACNALMLHGDREQRLAGWLDQVTALYDNLAGDAGYMACMRRYGYDEDCLAEERALLNAVVEANLVRQKARGRAQEGTGQRDAAMAALDDWMSAFKAIARLAQEEHDRRLRNPG